MLGKKNLSKIEKHEVQRPVESSWACLVVDKNNWWIKTKRKILEKRTDVNCGCKSQSGKKNGWWRIKVQGESFTLDKKLLFSYVSEQRRTVNEFNTLSDGVDGSESQMLSSVISKRMLTNMIEQQLHARLHDSFAKAEHSAKALMCQEDRQE